MKVLNQTKTGFVNLDNAVSVFVANEREVVADFAGDIGAIHLGIYGTYERAQGLIGGILSACEDKWPVYYMPEE